MLNTPRYFSPYYFASRYWLSHSATSASPKNRPKWGGHFVGAGYFQSHYFDTGLYTPDTDYLAYPVNYWPQWCARTDSLLTKYLEAVVTAVDTAEVLQVESALLGAVNDYTGNDSREWIVPTTIDPELITTVSFTIGANNVTPTLTRSWFEYDNSPGPVAIVYEGMLRARNLAVLSNSVTSNASGGVTLVTTPPIDSIIWSKLGPQYEPLLPQYSMGGQGSTFYTFPSQEFPVYYAHPVLEALTPTCRINSGPSLTMEEFKISNDLDAKAKVWGLTRLEDETNYALRSRIGCRAALWTASPRDRFIGEMAVDFGLCTLYSWATSGSLTISDSQVVHLPNLPEIVRATVIASPSGYTSYSLNQDIDLAYMVYGNRVVQATPVSGFFSVPVSGLGGLVVSEQFTTFTTSSSSSGVTGLFTTRNTLGDTLDVVATQGVRSIDLWDNTQSDLYLPNGCSTSLLKNLADTVQLTAAKCYGKSYWESAHWFTTTEARPTLSYLPEELE